jgi:hypothetical protein
MSLVTVGQARGQGVRLEPVESSPQAGRVDRDDDAK